MTVAELHAMLGKLIDLQSEASHYKVQILRYEATETKATETYDLAMPVLSLKRQTLYLEITPHSRAYIAPGEKV